MKVVHFPIGKLTVILLFQFISVRRVQNRVYTSLRNLARLLKLIQETSQSTSDRYGKNLVMRANIMTRGFDLPELLVTKVLQVMLPNFSDEASCRNNAWNYLHVEFHTTGRPSLSALVDELLL